MLLNVGSGQRPFPKPWINVDINPRWNPDIVADGATMNLPSDSADVIVLHHTLEHYGCGEADMLVRNCHRILKPGGSLLVFVPDMRALVHMWLKGKIDAQLFMTNAYGAYHGHEADRHRWGYDQGLLLKFLNECSRWYWSGLFDWKKDRAPGADLVRAEWILGVEAIK